MPKLKYENIVSNKEIKDFVKPNLWNDVKDYLYYFIKVFVIISCVFIFWRGFVVDLIVIEGQSMFPNYNQDPKTSDKIYVNKFTPKFSSFKRGQVVVLIAPQGCRSAQKTFYIKRIIGLPRETIRLAAGSVFIINEQYPQGQKLDESNYLKPEVKTYKMAEKPDEKITIEKTLGASEYYFMGDNRPGSKDSRYCGPVQKDQILGEEIYRATPINKQKFFELPKYNIPNQ